MGDEKGLSSLLDYYRENVFNPVPISVEDRETWHSHIAKRRNLYEKHLGIPLSLLRGRSVLEFGCNSGENSLVLAMFGANLTLVEPNEQVLPRLIDLFERFGLTHQIKEIRKEAVSNFESESHYDVVIAEGFLYTLSNRDEILKKTTSLLASGGLGIISFNDRYGGLIEFTKRLVLWHACRLIPIDVHGEGSLELAKSLFGKDFMKLNTSRPFSVWWKDTMVNPFIATEYLWSFLELFVLIEKTRCEFLSSSPRWSFSEHFNWYKNSINVAERHKELLNDWRRAFTYVLTGIKPKRLNVDPANDEVIDSVAGLVSSISAYTLDKAEPDTVEAIVYPDVLDDYLSGANDPILQSVNGEMKELFGAVKRTNANELIDAYLGCKVLRSLWGTAYHYMSFIKF